MRRRVPRRAGVRAWVFGALLGAAAAGAARAETPWLEQGDVRARQDVEVLKAFGLIRGPVQSWPLPWAQVMDGVEAAEAGPVTPGVRAAAARLRALADIAEQGVSGEAQVAGTNRPALVRDFGFTAREQADVAGRVTANLGALSVTAGVGYRTGQAGPDYHFEPSSAVLRLGNWAVYGGYVPKFWGPGNDGAIILSGSARPFPKAGVSRLYPYKPEPRLLRWVGPWRFDFFGGVLTETRVDVRNPVVFGMSFRFEPARGFEVGLNRTIMICGGAVPTTRFIPGDPTGGLQCSPGALVRALVPFVSGTVPGDGLAGIDLSYTARVGRGGTVKVYFDTAGEDNAGIVVDQVGRKWGVSGTFPVGGGGAVGRVYAEYTDTLALFVILQRFNPGSFYGNVFFYDGKRYRRDAIGESIGSDSDLITLSGSVTDVLNRRWYASVRHGRFNRTGLGAVAVSANAETITIGTVGAEVPTRLGDWRLEARAMDNDVNTPGRRPGRGEVELSWRGRF